MELHQRLINRSCGLEHSSMDILPSNIVVSSFLTFGKSIDLYRNLHKPGYASVRLSGKVVGYGKELMLKECRFHIGETRRQRVIAEKKKNVHAWVKGKSCDAGFFDTRGFRELYYNPYTTSCFLTVDTKEKAVYAKKVVFKDNRCYAFGLEVESV